MQSEENSVFEDNESDVSELTDIFEEFHQNSFLRRNAVPEKTYLSKNEADWKTVESFTDDFKRAMQDARCSSEVSIIK